MFQQKKFKAETQIALNLKINFIPNIAAIFRDG